MAYDINRQNDADAATLPTSVLKFCVEHSANPVGPTTALIRSRLSKESLQQRLLEIAQETLYCDKRLNALLEKSGSASIDEHRLRYQAEWDRLTHESDEIEYILNHKFMMRGGGRLLLDSSTMNAVTEANRIGKDETYSANQRFGIHRGNENENADNDESEDWGEAMLDEDINSDMDSECDVDIGSDSEFERDHYHQNSEMQGLNASDSIQRKRRFSTLSIDGQLQELDVDQVNSSMDTTTTATQDIINMEGDEDTIYEPLVRRKKSPPKTPMKPQESDDTTTTSVVTQRDSSPDLKNEVPLKETRTQKFKRLERNWRKDRRYSDPFHTGGTLSKLGQYYEQQQEARHKKRRKSRSRSAQKAKRPTKKTVCKREQFCYQLGTVRIHLENEHLDGCKPEDLRPFVSPHVEYCDQENTDDSQTPVQQRRIHLGTIKLDDGSDSILSLLIQLSQRCGVLTHRCQIVLEQQYVSAQEEDIIEMLNEARRQQSDQSMEGTPPRIYDADSERMDSDQDIVMDRKGEDSDPSEVKASEIAAALLKAYPAVDKWLRSKPKWHRGILVNDGLAQELLDRLVQQQSDWRQVIQKIKDDIQETRRPPITSNSDGSGDAQVNQSSTTAQPESETEVDNESIPKPLSEDGDEVVECNMSINAQPGLDDATDSTMKESTNAKSEADPTNLKQNPINSEIQKNVPSDGDQQCTELESVDNLDDYTGSDEFVSGLLMVTVYLSRDVFVKRNILRSMKHIKAFDALLDILEDGNEVIGLTECFPLPINDRHIQKQHIQSFETWQLYERLRPKWDAMCTANPDGMTATLWDYQRKAVQWMLQRESTDRMVPNLLWRKAICRREDNETTSNTKQFWFHIDHGAFWDGSHIDEVRDTPGGILADQMGLGKTVECLALILLNPQRYWSYGQPVGIDRFRMFHEEDDDSDRESENEVMKQEPHGEPDSESIAQFMGNEQLLCESRATLIVLPTNILHQWKSEILSHAPHLSVYIYLGINGWKKQRERIRKRKRKHELEQRRNSKRFSASEMSGPSPRKRRRLSTNREAGLMDAIDDNDVSGTVAPSQQEDIEEPTYRKLATYDVVLTDYAVLRAESNYSTPLRYKFRRKKRHEIPDTPLLQIRWWRLILDEAQQIESRVSQSARMALKLDTKYRWAVTGTPIGKNGLDDLYGLVKFLKVEPFNTPVAWLRTVAEPYYNGDDRRLLAILKRIMWRQAKHHVADELNLPPRTEEYLELTFSGVEQEYYKRLHNEFADTLKREGSSLQNEQLVFHRTSNTPQRTRKSNVNVTGGINQQLEVLRQACCHPQISRQTFLNTTKKENGGIMTMKEIMNKMIEDANDQMTVDERELSRAGTYYSDWLIYRNSHGHYDQTDPDAELKNIQRAVDTLEEVFKVEQCGIEHIGRTAIIKGIDDDTIRYDGAAEYDQCPAEVDTVPGEKAPKDDARIDKIEAQTTSLVAALDLPVFPLMISSNTVNGNSTSIHPIQAVPVPVPDPNLVTGNNIVKEIGATASVAVGKPLDSSSRDGENAPYEIPTLSDLPSTQTMDDNIQRMKDDLDEASLSPRPPIKMALALSPPARTQCKHSNVEPSTEPPISAMHIDSGTESPAGESDEDYVPSDTEMQHQPRDDEFIPVPLFSQDDVKDADLMDVVPSKEEADAPSPQEDASQSNAPEKTATKSIESLKSTKFDRFPKSSLQSLQRLNVDDRVATYMFGKWQPAKIVAKSTEKVVVHFTHFDDRGSDMDQLLPLDPEVLSTNHIAYALSTARDRTSTRDQSINATDSSMLEPVPDVVLDLPELGKGQSPKASEENKENSNNEKTEKFTDHRYKELDITESNEKYYQWKKCEIATAHHLKYLYQRLLEDPRKFHLSSRDKDILNQKVAKMEESYAFCRKELQEQVEMKVDRMVATIVSYEKQIDEWSGELKRKEIDELVKIRENLPIEKWKSKQFDKVHKYYNKFNVQKQEMTRKLQYACFKDRKRYLETKMSEWTPSFIASWDRINEEYRRKFLANTFESKVKVSSKSEMMRVVKTKWTLNQYLVKALQNCQIRMNHIEQQYRSIANEVNQSQLSLEDLMSTYRAEWNDLSDICVVFQVFKQIYEDHKRLKKCKLELADSVKKLEIHCAIVDDFDTTRWTVQGIEDHLVHRYQMWKQKALGKAQQLRYLQQKHEILQARGCRVEQECAICKQTIRDPTLTPCGHLFCEPCIFAWLNSLHRNATKACPQCRHRITRHDVFHVAEYLTQSSSSYIHASISSVFNGTLQVREDREEKKKEDENTDNKESEENEESKECVDEDEDIDLDSSMKELDANHKMKEKQADLGTVRSGSHIDEMDIFGKGDYGTKIESLVKYLKWLSIEQPDAKSLVYSQFNALLEIIAAVLHENGIHAIHQNAGSATMSRQEKAGRIETFQTDPEVRVLLLSLRTDSSGLTLIQATHVFLLEPSLNEAIEAQAIDRVHRVGQTKPTFVHRYFMKGTVEENILRQRFDKYRDAKSKRNDQLNKGQNKEKMTMEELRKLFGS